MRFKVQIAQFNGLSGIARIETIGEGERGEKIVWIS